MTMFKYHHNSQTNTYYLAMGLPNIITGDDVM